MMIFSRQRQNNHDDNNNHIGTMTMTSNERYNNNNNNNNNNKRITQWSRPNTTSNNNKIRGFVLLFLSILLLFMVFVRTPTTTTTTRTTTTISNTTRFTNTETSTKIKNIQSSSTNQLEQQQHQCKDYSYLYSNSSETTATTSSTTTSTTSLLPQRRTIEESNVLFQSWEQNVKPFILQRQLTFMEPEALKYHANNIDWIERNNIPGIIIECGVAKAGSSLSIVSMKHVCRELHLYDTFQGIPEPSKERDGQDVHERYKAIQISKQKCQQQQQQQQEQDIDDDNNNNIECDRSYYGNMKNLLEFDQLQFQELGYNLQHHHVYFHKGLFDDTVWPIGPVAYVHLDGDWYDSTKNMLERIAPYISVGGYFVLDDVFAWSGARNAFSDFFNVNVEWLQQQQQQQQQQQSNQGCYIFKAEKHFKVFLDIRASAQVLKEKDTTLIPCTKE